MDDVTLLPWAVVVFGRWNRSILTPANIAQKLLGLPEQEQIQVEIPLNVAGPPRVRRSGVAISVEEHQLFIEIERGNYEALGVALQAASMAVSWLKETPFAGTAIMVTFKITEVTEERPSSTNMKWDKSLAAEYEISRHIAGRSVKWGDSRIVIVADRGEDGSSMVVIHFERRSDKGEDLNNLLKMPVTDFKGHIESLLGHLKTGGVS